MSIFTRRFWKAAGERAARGGAIAAATHLGGDVITASALRWWEAGPWFLAGAVISVLFSLIGSTSGDGGPSFTGTEALPPGPSVAHDERTAGPAGD